MNNLPEALRISPFQIRVFIGTFLCMFIIVSLQYLGVHTPWKYPKLVFPVPQGPKADTMNTIRPMLEKKTSSFYLQKDNSLVAKTYANTENIDAAAYTVIDLDNGQVIAEKNGDKQLPIASLTKIMTSVVALDLANTSDLFTITEKAASMQPTKLGVIPGQKMTLDELLHGALMTSANDAAQAINDGVNTKYGQQIFVDAMNEKAAVLHLDNTHFANPQGFDNTDNYSSVDDLARLSEYALTQYPEIAKIVKEDYTFLPANQYHKQFDLNNWNGLLDVYPGAAGVKIGNTGAAGTTTVVYSNRGGKNILAVVLGTQDILKRDMAAASLLDLGYQKTLGLDPINVTEEQLRAKYATWKYYN